MSYIKQLAIKTLVGVTAAVLMHHVYVLLRLKRQTNLPINIWTIPLLGEVQYVIDFIGSKDHQLKLHKRLGPVFASILFGKPTVFIGSTEKNDMVHYSTVNKDGLGIEHIESIKSILSPDAMVMMDAGPKHDEQRQIIMTLIGQKSLPPLFPAIAKEFHNAIEVTAGNSGSGEWQNVFEILKDSIWSIMYRVTLGECLQDTTVFDEMKTLFVDFGAGLFSLPIQKRYRDAKQASERLFELVQQEFSTRVPTSEAATDLIQAHVNHATKFNCEPNMKGRVIDIYGSLDTTKSFSTVMFELLVERPALLEKIYREEVLPNLGNEGLLHESASFELISNKMPLVCAVVNEVLRFANITPYIMRVAKRDLELGDNQYIPQGAYVLSSNFNIIHTNPYTQHADEFQPERYLAPRLEREADMFKSGSGKQCFGFGHRTCPGQQLAIAEMRAFLVEMSYYTWEMKEKPQYEWNPVPSCSKGFMVRGERRLQR